MANQPFEDVSPIKHGDFPPVYVKFRDYNISFHCFGRFLFLNHQRKNHWESKGAFPPMPPFFCQEIAGPYLREYVTTMVPKGPGPSPRAFTRYKRFRMKQSKDLEDVSKFPAMVPLVQLAKIRGM